MQIEPLPEVQVNFITTEDLFTLLQEFDRQQCRDPEGRPLLTILDFRNANHIKQDKPLPHIATDCPVSVYLLDDILKPEVRDELPREVRAITITETGSRDEFVIRYLSQYGFSTIQGLEFGMRGWLKQRYPTR